MSKLVIDLLGFERGKAFGFEEYVLNLLGDFKQYREKLLVEDITLVVEESQHDFFNNYFKEFFNIYIVTIKNIIGRLRKSRLVPSALNLKADDIILYVGNTMPLTGVKTKTLLVVHDLLFLHGSLFSISLYDLLFRTHRYIYISHSLKQANKIIAISKFTRDEIINTYGIKPDKIVPIYNYFNFGKYDQIDGRTVNNVSNKYILTVCSGAKHKNHITMLKAFEMFNKKYCEYKFVLVGHLSASASKYYNNMDDEVKKNIVILHHLSNSDMRIIYQNALMYVSASLYEGLGMPVVEALYFGLPTILSDILIHHEVSLNNATFFNPMLPEELCKCIELNMQNKRSTDKAFSDLLIEMYDSNHTSMKYVEEINKLANSHDMRILEERGKAQHINYLYDA